MHFNYMAMIEGIGYGCIPPMKADFPDEYWHVIWKSTQALFTNSST
jgi:hypothetical protein